LNVPEIVDGVMPYTNYLADDSTLSPRHRELLILRVAWLCGSESLWATHAARARSAGLTTAEIRNVAQGPETKGWDPFEATLLRVVDQLFRNSSVADATWQALAAKYDMFHLMDAVETAGHFVMLAMVYNSLGVQPDTTLSDRLPKDVPYRVVVPAREPALATARFTPVEGRGISVNRTMARYPKLYERWQPRQGLVVRVSKLPPKQRELLTLRTGWNCQSEYEWAKHVGTVGRARDHGLDPVQIAEGANSPVWDATEKALIRAADELYRDTVVSEATWRALSPQLGPELMMTAVVTVSDFRTISMSLNAYGVQLEEGDEHFPKVSSR
jgi:alkylhydroperoxidase family enzyme